MPLKNVEISIMSVVLHRWHLARALFVIFAPIFPQITACSPTQRDGRLGASIPEDHQIEIHKVLTRFWSAAAVGDSPAMQRFTEGSRPLHWVADRRAAYPGLFRETAGELELEDLYFATPQADTVTVQIRVPWVSCPPPAHEGERDRYYIKVTNRKGEWRILDIWQDIC